ncbi:MAG: hypothetical protein KDC54_10410 [Lewinella sp.]|nr:hypothetical protein [Lewinella sp.]
MIRLPSFSRLLGLVLLLIGHLLPAQSGWVRSPGELYAQVSGYAFSSRDYYSVSGQLFDQGAVYSSQVYNLYGEYGLSDRLTLIANWPALVRNRYSTTNAVYGLGDASLSAKYGLLRAAWPVSLTLGAELPVGNKNLYARAREPNELGMITVSNLPSGDGELNLLGTLAASHSCWGGRAYATAYVTYNFRTQGYSDQWRLGAELGVRPLDGLWLSGKYFTQLKGPAGTTENTSFFRAEGTTYSLLSFGGSWQVWGPWHLNAFLHLPVNDLPVPFRNVYVGRAFSVGVAYQGQVARM